jgi:VIT1/CCC1 family predicted Fe2+/Mn2+ transporter
VPDQDGQEEHEQNLGGFLNWLRAAVLGANDGVVSVAGLVMGVAGGTSDNKVIMLAGIAGLVSGALSMAVGEYVSVSTQRDTERALIAKERRELRETPGEELDELAQIYEDKGLKPETARQVAEELSQHDVLRAHLDAELGIDPGALTNPYQAALASLIAFTLGAALPLITITLSPPDWRIWVTLASVTVALAGTGYVSARLGGANRGRAMARVAVGGLMAMAVTWVIGYLIGGAAGG